MFGKRFSRALAVTAVASLVMVTAAFAHAVTDTAISINGGATYTNSLTATVSTAPDHCPPGGDMSAFELSLSNDNVTFTIVKAAATPWPAGNCVGGVAPATAASFSWTLAAGADGSRTVYAKFRHGADVGTSSDTITLDTTPPVITAGVATGTAGTSPWYISAVSQSFSATDTGGSGIACTSPWSVSSGTNEGSAVSIASGACSDLAGNTNPGINAGPFSIDLTDPTAVIDSPADGATTSDASIGVVVSASDTPSGVAGVSISGSAASLDPADGKWKRTVGLDCGANIITAAATDNAGRTSTQASITVTRTCGPTYTTSGFFRPVDMGGVLNKAKAGQTVPLKFDILADGVAVENDTSLVGITVRSINCSTTGTQTDVIEEYSQSASGLRWDAGAQQYVFNFATQKSWVNQCRTVTLYLDGDEAAVAYFNFTK